MTEAGKVVEVKGNKAVVRFSRKAACDNCNMCLMRKKDMHIDMVMDNSLSALVDDTVVVEMTGGGVTLAAMIIYGVPLLIMLGAMLLAILLKAPDYIIGLVAGGACLFAYAVIFAINRVAKPKKKLEPKMIKIEAKKAAKT